MGVIYFLLWHAEPRDHHTLWCLVIRIHFETWQNYEWFDDLNLFGWVFCQQRLYYRMKKDLCCNSLLFLLCRHNLLFALMPSRDLCEKWHILISLETIFSKYAIVNAKISIAFCLFLIWESVEPSSCFDCFFVRKKQIIMTSHLFKHHSILTPLSILCLIYLPSKEFIIIFKS